MTFRFLSPVRAQVAVHVAGQFPDGGPVALPQLQRQAALHRGLVSGHARTPAVSRVAALL